MRLLAGYTIQHIPEDIGLVSMAARLEDIKSVASEFISRKGLMHFPVESEPVVSSEPIGPSLLPRVKSRDTLLRRAEEYDCGDAVFIEAFNLADREAS